jgi:hypothetical protein
MSHFSDYIRGLPKSLHIHSPIVSNMGSMNSIPLVSQAKLVSHIALGDIEGAVETHNDFANRNTFPVISQLQSMSYALNGDLDDAVDLQEKFASDMSDVIDSIPVAGHAKGGLHYALGQNEKGDNAIKASTRSTAVIVGGALGFAAGGPLGAAGGGIAGGLAVDSAITG